MVFHFAIELNIKKSDTSDKIYVNLSERKHLFPVQDLLLHIILTDELSSPWFLAISVKQVVKFWGQLIKQLFIWSGIVLSLGYSECQQDVSSLVIQLPLLCHMLAGFIQGGAVEMVRVLTVCSTKSGEGNGTPLQYSCLENPMDGGAWQATVAEQFHFHFSLLCIGEGNGSPLQCSCLENPRDGVTQSQTRLK